MLGFWEVGLPGYKRLPANGKWKNLSWDDIAATASPFRLGESLDFEHRPAVDSETLLYPVIDVPCPANSW